MTASAEQILAKARTQIGTVQAANGANKYGAAYGMDRVAWCAQFVWWVFRECGALDLIHPKTAYTPTSAQWHRNRGQWGSTPRVGALVYFTWPNGPNRISHIGVVESVERDAIVTIEGNTTPPAGTGNQRMGGGVWRRRRTRNSTIVGYGYPAYAAVTTSEEDELTPEERDTLARVPVVERKLDLLLQQMVFGEGDPAKPDTWGWPLWGGGTGKDESHGRLTIVDMGRRSNVETRQAWLTARRALDEAAAVRAAVEGGVINVSGGAQLGELEITGIARPRQS